MEMCRESLQNLTPYPYLYLNLFLDWQVVCFLEKKSSVAVRPPTFWSVVTFGKALGRHHHHQRSRLHVFLIPVLEEEKEEKEEKEEEKKKKKKIIREEKSKRKKP